MSYNDECYQLAENFLGGDPEIAYLNTVDRCDKLAQAIQDAIEAFIAHEKDNYEPPDDPVAWSGGLAAPKGD